MLHIPADLERYRMIPESFLQLKTSKPKKRLLNDSRKILEKLKTAETRFSLSPIYFKRQLYILRDGVKILVR
jgi:hypothetical protein